MKKYRRLQSTKRSENLFIRFCKAYPEYDRRYPAEHAQETEETASYPFEKTAGTQSA